MTPAVLAGWSALIAAAATVIGAATLVLFFSRGQPWGRRNDASSVVLMLALVPVALLIATLQSERIATVALAVAALGISAMVGAAVLQALLVLGRVTFEGTRRAVLAGGAAVGVWYVLSGWLAHGTGMDGPLAWTAVAAGLGFIGVTAGFALGGERHPLSAAGGGVAAVASTAFLAVLGTRLVTGDLVVPAWNA